MKYIFFMNNQSFDDFSLINLNSSFSANHTNNTQSQNLEMTNGVPFVSSNLKQVIQKILIKETVIRLFDAYNGPANENSRVS